MRDRLKYSKNAATFFPIGKRQKNFLLTNSTIKKLYNLGLKLELKHHKLLVIQNNKKTKFKKLKAIFVLLWCLTVVI